MPNTSILNEDNDEFLIESANKLLSGPVGECIYKKKVLDFGCGKGHVVEMADKMAMKAYGYDIIRHDSQQWNNNKLNLSTYWPRILSNGPYDVVICNDVLDHSVAPMNDLLKIFSVLNRSGKVFFRFHPYCSRTGGHLYKFFNKAYLHLVLSKQELNMLDLPTSGQKVMYPILTYEYNLNSIGFKIVNVSSVTQEVDDFFTTNELIAKRIMSRYNLVLGKNPIPVAQMRQSYVDIVATKGSE